MNFLMRSTQPAVPEQPTVHDLSSPSHSAPKMATTLEGLIAEDPFPDSDDDDKNGDGLGNRTSGSIGSSAKNQVPIVDKHSDVTEKEGWIIIPCEELPENWSDAADILSFRSLDRSFAFPGEQVHILACLSASKQDTEIITPFKVAAVMSKSGSNGHTSKQQNEGIESSSLPDGGVEKPMHQCVTGQSTEQNGESLLNEEKINTQVDISASESLLRMEDHRKQTELLLARFRNSHFFVRVAESDEPLWSKRSMQEPPIGTSDFTGDEHTATEAGNRKAPRMETCLNAYIDRGSFDANISGGLSRNAVKCCSLSNGDIVVLLQVNVGINFLKDPVLEILQFEKYQDRSFASVNPDNLVYTNHKDPCGELLKWLLPLDRTLPPPARPLSPPPPLSSTSAFGSVSQRSNFSASSGSQLFSHFRSYSMSSFPPNTAPPPAVTTSSSIPVFDPDEWDRHSAQKLLSSQDAGNASLLSFRGVPLEPDRFSVRCGLEGIYLPGRRWRKKLEIIQPVEIHSFAAECNTEDLLCVQIKNVSPPHIPDIVIFVDSIAIVFEEAPKGGPAVSLPIACVEAGTDHNLPNLSLRRNEEHSFILKPAASMLRNIKAHNERSQLPLYSQSGNAIPNLYLPSKTGEGKKSSSADQYAVLLSCRCNYTESRLFFKQPTTWRPRVVQDLMISVASEMSEQTLGSNGGLTQLPVQVLTLQASNLTSEDLTLTLLAPVSAASPASVVSLNSAPSTPVSPFVGFSEFAGKFTGERRSTGVQRLSSMPQVSDTPKERVAGGGRSVSFDEHTVSMSDVVPTNGLGFTHLWLQSTVPLGCVPSRSAASVKLELLPLTDGIITLDSLQISVKEKGRTYVPEHSLKINATSSIATGII